MGVHVEKQWLRQLPSTCLIWAWLPLPFPFGELRVHVQVTGAVPICIPDPFIIIIRFSSCAERAGHVGSHQGHTEGQHAKFAERFAHETMAPGDTRRDDAENA